jgi:flagellar motor switch protein FliG
LRSLSNVTILHASASSAENEARRAASLRRIAIVLRDLPESTAAKLLADLGPQARARVGRELANLVDVDPMERKRALESFAGSLKRQASRYDEVRGGRLDGYDSDSFDQATDDMNPRPTGPQTARNSRVPSAYYPGPSSDGSDRFESPSNAQATPPPSALAFLDQVTDGELMEVLGDEHPQTKAVVLASIDPARAARLLPRLGSAQRNDMLSRIGRLQAIPDEMLVDLASSFRERIERIQAKKNRNPLQRLIDQNEIDFPAGESSAAGWDPAQAARHVPQSAAAVSPRLQAILSEMPISEPSSNPTPAGSSAGGASAWGASAGRSGAFNSKNSALNSQDEAASEVAERLRRITREESRTDSGRDSSRQASPVETPNRTRKLSTDDIHQELVALPARQLCEALGRVETRVAILALCGLPNHTADAAIACLPRAQANQVRQHLMSVGSMEIREIDQAKEVVADAAKVLSLANKQDAPGANAVPPTRSTSSPSSRQELRQAAA